MIVSLLFTLLLLFFCCGVFLGFLGSIVYFFIIIISFLVMYGVLGIIILEGRNFVFFVF